MTITDKWYLIRNPEQLPVKTMQIQNILQSEQKKKKGFCSPFMKYFSSLSCTIVYKLSGTLQVFHDTVLPEPEIH